MADEKKKSIYTSRYEKGINCHKCPAYKPLVKVITDPNIPNRILRTEVIDVDCQAKLCPFV